MSSQEIADIYKKELNRFQLKDVIVNVSKTAGIAIKKAGITKETDTD